jgi:predicted nucleotidyltransferase
MPKAGRYYRVSGMPWLRPLLGNVAFALLVHWCFQGLLYADRTERAFKVGLTATGAILLTGFLGLFLPLGWAFVIALVVAHTLSFAMNSHPFVVLKHFGMVKTGQKEVEGVIQRLATESSREPGIVWAGVYGSLARNSWNEFSDLDVRLVRRPGWANGIRACWFLLRQRALATWQRFPLDMYVLDSPKLLERMRADEPPLVILDRSSSVNRGQTHER